jgi:hypothetical protein
MVRSEWRSYLELQSWPDYTSTEMTLASGDGQCLKIVPLPFAPPPKVVP